MEATPSIRVFLLQSWLSPSPLKESRKQCPVERIARYRLLASPALIPALIVRIILALLAGNVNRIILVSTNNCPVSTGQMQRAGGGILRSKGLPYGSAWCSNIAN